MLGKAVPSLDTVALMTGRFEFVHNVHVPGMVHGRVVRPPETGGDGGACGRRVGEADAGLYQSCRAE